MIIDKLVKLKKINKILDKKLFLKVRYLKYYTSTNDYRTIGYIRKIDKI